MANSEPLNLIKQTSKTILFEKFNDDTVDLYTLIKNEKVTNKDEFFKIVEEKLSVRNFKDFCERFMPTVWEWIIPTNNPEQPVEFHYSMEDPRIEGSHIIKLDKNEFYTMVMNLYDKKGSSGDTNLNYDYSDVNRMLSPEKVFEKAKQLRKDYDYNCTKYLTLGDSAKQERNKCIKNINNIRKEIVSQYRDNFTGILKLALADTQDKIECLCHDEKNDNNISIESPAEETKRICSIGYKDDGSLDVQLIEVKDNHTELTIADTSKKNELFALIGKDYDSYSENNLTFIKNLVLSTYCGKQIIATPDIEQLVANRNQYASMYKDSQEKFIRAISSAIEKILNVKTFFEHASVNNKNLPAPLIVANCKSEQLLEDETVKNDFITFLKESSNEDDVNRIWFAIIPAIGDSDFIDNVDEGELSFGDLEFEEDTTVKTTDGDKLTSLSTLKAMLNILRQAKITTFFNFRANEKTGFAKFNEEIIEQYREKIDSINGNPYAVFCYPNFTVLPKKETYIQIAKRGDIGNEKSEYIDIPGIYLDSSYVAAGLIVGSQNPDYLAEKFPKILKGYPCVRFDIERNSNRFILITKLNRETGSKWLESVEKNLCKDKLGFCFCCNRKFNTNQQIKNSYVETARNMCKDEKSGEYEHICQRLTMDFVEQYLRARFASVRDDKMSSSDANEFMSEVAEWRRKAKDGYENSILIIGSDDTAETIEKNENGFTVSFIGKDGEVPIKIVKE